jgi:spore maturation protein CgeB
MDEAIGTFDLLLYCKSYERADYERLGKPLIYLPLGYCDEVHRPAPGFDARWHSMVGFLGGWEPRRERLMREIVRAGIELKIWGENWDFLRDGRWSPRRYVVLRQLAGEDQFRIHRDPGLATAHQGREVYGDDYARALTGSNIGLGFLRKVCPDQHTTRSFEIPACGSMLLADRTGEHCELFEEGKEAEFFGSGAELLDKLKFYASNTSARKQVASAGYDRCVRGRYSYIHRLKAALDAIAMKL